MLLTEKNPRVMIKIGYVSLLFFFAMNFLPHPTTSFGDGVFDGVHGALLGVAIGLLGWGTYINRQEETVRSMRKLTSKPMPVYCRSVNISLHARESIWE